MTTRSLQAELGAREAVPRVLFIGGYARSGSTVLDIALGAVPGFCSVGELRFVWQRGFVEDQRCACGEPFGRCHFWTRVVDVAFGGRQGIDLDAVLGSQNRVDQWWRVPQLLGSGSAAIAEDLAIYLDALESLYRAIVEVSGAQVIVDSSKDASHGYLLRSMGSRIDLRVVHLVRDARAVAYSLCERRKFDPGSGHELGGHGYVRAAAGWSVTNLLVEGLRAPQRPYLRLSYERFAAAPEPSLRRIVRFAGGDDGAVAMPDDTLDLDREHHTVAGNPMRFERGSQPIRADEAWRHQMTRRGRRIVGALTWPLAARYRAVSPETAERMP